MAEKLKKQKGAAQPEASELEILYPNADIQVRGEKVTVREYGFVEGLRLKPLLGPILDALHALIEQEGAGLTVDSIFGLLADHHESVLQLVATATDHDMDWMESLSDQEGQDLLLIWWHVNGPFFVRSVRRRLAAQQLAAQREKAPKDGETSSAHSSPTDTTQTDSGSTQSDS